MSLRNRLDAVRSMVAAVAQGRTDGWENWVTGIGTNRDKTASMAFCESYRLTNMEISSLYHLNDLAAKIVDFRPNEMFREGITMEDEDTEARDAIVSYLEETDLLTTMLEAIIWGRAYGGNLMIIGADDGRDASEPLDEENIKSIDFWTNIDRRYVTPNRYYEDPKAPKYMMPESYQVSDLTGTVYLDLHESRTVRFGGARTDQLRRRGNNGWDYSVLQRPIDVLRSFEQNWKSCDNLISDASQGVFKMKGLANALASQDGAATMQLRMQLMDMCRSVARAILLDAEEGEDFTRVATSFTGLPDLLDRAMMRLSAATGIPVAILMGRSAGGLNATGDSDFKAFYDSVKAEQKTFLLPMLRRLMRLVMLNKSGPTKGVVSKTLKIGFPPLWQPTPVEVATIKKLNAETDAIRVVQCQQWLPSELAISRFEGGDDAPVAIDVGLRKRLLAHEIEEALQPDPETQGSGAANGSGDTDAGDSSRGSGKSPKANKAKA